MPPMPAPNNPAKSRLSLAVFLHPLAIFWRPLVDFWRHITQRFHDLKKARAKMGWRPKEISLPWMTSLLLLEVGIISTIIALLIISAKLSGFVGLNNTPRWILGHPQLAAEIWPGFFYRALPTFLMTWYSNLRDGTLTAVWDRQPYVELAKREKNSSLQKTVMLDYSKVTWWKRGYMALRNRHYVIAACAIVGNIYSLAMIPLTSYLFTAVQFDLNNTLLANATRAFNGSVFSQDDMRPALDTVNSVLIYGANQPAWTIDEYAFPSFSVDGTSGNVTTESFGFSANLDCNVISQDEYTTQIDNSTFTISANDRGCNISLSADLPFFSGVTVSTSAEEACSLQNGVSRLLVSSWNGTSTDSQMPLNLSFISCMPTYWKTPGNLTVNFGLPSEPVVASFTPHNKNASQFSLDSQVVYERTLQTILTFDIQSSVQANDFGRLVYNFAQLQDPQSPLDAGQLKNSTVIIYASVFAAFSSYAFFQALSPSANITVIATESVTRLIVVPPIAYTILGIMSLAFLLTIWLFFYTNRPSSLVEKPIGLLGAAAILHGSEIMEIVGKVKTEAKERGSDFDGKVIELISENYDLSDVSCYWSKDPPDNSKIVVEPKSLQLKTVEPRVRKARWFSLLRHKKGQKHVEK